MGMHQRQFERNFTEQSSDMGRQAASYFHASHAAPSDDYAQRATVQRAGDGA